MGSSPAFSFSFSGADSSSSFSITPPTSSPAFGPSTGFSFGSTSSSSFGSAGSSSSFSGFGFPANTSSTFSFGSSPGSRSGFATTNASSTCSTTPPSTKQTGPTNSSSGKKVPIAEAEVVPEASCTGASSGSRRSDSPDFPDSSSSPPMDSSKKFSTSSHDSTPETTTIPVINLEVMVEKKKNRVVFAESNKDFIDLLFSLLTLSIGTIINLLGDKLPPTVIGCVNNLYKSVENLDTQLLRTEACKEILLQRRRLPEFRCGNLIVKNQLATLWELIAAASCDQGEGGFLRGGAERFLISDDLKVMPGSSSPCFMLLKKLSIVDAKELESQSMNVGPVEILQLLRSSLLSKTPLTHWFLLKEGASDLIELELNNMAESLDKRSATSDSKKMNLKLFISKSREQVLYAESGEDFVDLLFSFLTFPLGSILKLLGGKSLLGCVDNLYGSVKDLSTDNYLKSEEVKNKLLCPKLAPFSACENQLLHVEESCSPQYLLYTYGESNTESFVRPNGSSFGEGLGQLSMVNPKSSTGETTGGGGYVKGPAKFMVTDALVVTQLSPISSISFLGKLDVPITDVDEKVVRVGEEEVLNLLKAALISETALTDVFNLTTSNVLE
uniref:Uncharacterized protein n=1 Tax=Davidia involucrata TaxID=16924 RepID=A0A5B7B3L5_DAVIN